MRGKEREERAKLLRFMVRGKNNQNGVGTLSSCSGKLLDHDSAFIIWTTNVSTLLPHLSHHPLAFLSYHSYYSDHKPKKANNRKK